MPSRLRLEKFRGPLRCAPDVMFMMRELKERVDEERRVGRRSWKSRKCARWLVPNWISNPSSVFPSGGLRTPFGR